MKWLGSRVANMLDLKCRRAWVQIAVEYGLRLPFIIKLILHSENEFLM